MTAINSIATCASSTPLAVYFVYIALGAIAGAMGVCMITLRGRK